MRESPIVSGILSLILESPLWSNLLDIVINIGYIGMKVKRYLPMDTSDSERPLHIDKQIKCPIVQRISYPRITRRYLQLPNYESTP